MSWQDDFHERISQGADCPVCGLCIVKVDYNGYAWKCSSSPPSGASVDFTTAMSYGRGTVSSRHTGLDFIRKMYPKRDYGNGWLANRDIVYRNVTWEGWKWTEPEEKKEPETENEFGLICP